MSDSPLIGNTTSNYLWILLRTMLENGKNEKNRGTYKVRNEIETKRNENETKSTKTKRNETKSTKWKRMKRNQRNQRKQNVIRC